MRDAARENADALEPLRAEKLRLDAFLLTTASDRGCEECVRRLLDQKVDIESTDQRGATALLCAAEIHRSSMVRLLLSRGASVDARFSPPYLPGRPLDALDVALATGASSRDDFVSEQEYRLTIRLLRSRFKRGSPKASSEGGKS